MERCPSPGAATTAAGAATTSWLRWLGVLRSVVARRQTKWSSELVERVKELVEDARTKPGCTILAGGKAPEPSDKAPAQVRRRPAPLRMLPLACSPRRGGPLYGMVGVCWPATV